MRGTTEDSANGNRATFGGTRTDGTDQAWGLEAAYMIGPFSVQGEYLTRTVDAMEGFEDLEATGYNVQLAYTSPVSRAPTSSMAASSTRSPENKRIGAWEVFYRFDDITVDETGVAPSGYVGALDSAEAGAKTHHRSQLVRQRVGQALGQLPEDQCG